MSDRDDPLLFELNNLPFIYLGEETEVLEVERFNREETSMRVTNHGTPTQVTTKTKFVRLHLKGDESIEMKVSNVRSMIEHQRERQ